MVFDLDPFADILPEPANINTRAGAKFQPKPKSRPQKGTVVTVPSSLPNATDTPQSEVTISDVQGNLQTDFKRAGETADIFSELESLDNILSQSTSGNASSVRKFQPKVRVNSPLRKKLPASCPVAPNIEGSVSHPEDLEEGHGLPALSSFDPSSLRACSSAPADTSPELLVSEELANNKEGIDFDYNRDLLLDNGRPELEESGAFLGLDSLDVISEANPTTGDAQLIPSETEYLDGDLTPSIPSECFLDISTTRTSDSAPTDPQSELPVTKEFTHLANTSNSKTVIPEEVLHPQAVPVKSRKEGAKSRKRKTSTVSEDTARKVPSGNDDEFSQRNHDERPVLAAVEGNAAGKSSMHLRKRSTAPLLADEMEDRTQENGDPLYEPSNSPIDEDDNNDGDDEYREEISCPKRTQRKSNRLTDENKKTVQRRKNASEGPDQLNKEPPKKKFSHSTRRNKRQVDKVLLETPEEEINPRKLIIKDLILLAEAKERILNKGVAAAKQSLPNQSVNTSFTQDASYDEDDPFASMNGLNPDDRDDDDATAGVKKLNYHSFMDRTPKERWSKQETELFYEAIQQFGTDFAMIQQLFPGRTRHQVKLKYKKEERQHPLRLSDALINRSKDHSHFELVIERLQQAAAQGQQNSNVDMESVGVTGEEEEGTPENNEEVAKSELEDVTKDLESEVAEVHSFVKSHESEDDHFSWSPYKSDYDEF